MFHFRGFEIVRRASAALFGSLPHGIAEADVAGESHLRDVPVLYLKVPRVQRHRQNGLRKATGSPMLRARGCGTGCEKLSQCAISKDTRYRQDVRRNKHVAIL